MIETDKYFPEASHEDMGVEERFLLFVQCIIRFIRHTVYTCAHDFAQTCGGSTGFARRIYISKLISTTKVQFLFWGYDSFSVVIPNCLVYKSALPIGTALLKRVFHVMTHGFNMGWNN